MQVIKETTVISYLDIYGLVIQCKTESPDLTAELLRPFAYFQATTATGASVTICVEEADPPYDTFPSLIAAFATPRNIVYRDGDRKIIDYFGNGVVIQRERDALYQICGTDRNFLVESFYLLILSLLGQFCDQKGLLRIHAMAMSYQNKAVLIMMPQGSGKSTMALALIDEPGFGYISDDDPIFDKKSSILPFPRPIGILNRKAIEEIPDEYVYKVDRMEFGLKYYVDCDYWKDKTENRPLKDIVLLVGRRILNGTPRIVELSKMKTLKFLIRDAVVGVGLYQGLEFLLNRSTRDTIAKIPVLCRRLMSALRLMRTAKAYQFTLSGVMDENLNALKDFLNKR